MLRTLFVWLIPVTGVAQTLVPTVMTPLDVALNETSGLLRVDGTLWTVLDSWNPNRLYQLDTITGAVLREVEVMNAGNRDWEEITTDGTWCYIGDFGNNAGDRTDLRVFRFPLAELADPDVVSVIADTITFAFADQTDFTPANDATNYDCEAFIAMDDSLFLFTKNWLNSETYLYAMSATPGEQLAVRRDTLQSEGLITGASYDPAQHIIALLGYTSSTYQPFIWRLSGFEGHAFFNGEAVRNPLQLALTQMEGLAWRDANSVFMSSERTVLSAARLWHVGFDDEVGITSLEGRSLPPLFPNPATDHVTIHMKKAGPLQVTDSMGRVVLERMEAAGDVRLDVGSLSPGEYVLRTSPRSAGRPLVILPR